MRSYVLVFLMLLITSCNRNKGNERLGEALPNFKLLLTDGKTELETKDIQFADNVVILYFGSKCVFSNEQMTDIVSNISKLNNVTFYACTTESLDEANLFSERFMLSLYPNIIVAIDKDRFIGDYFKAEGLPFIAIYGKDKTLKKTYTGKIGYNLFLKV